MKKICLYSSLAFLFLFSLFSFGKQANAIIEAQEEHLHFLNITSGTGTTSADIIYPHNPPDGHSITSISWATAPAGAGGDIILECKPTATSTSPAQERFETNNNTFGFIETLFYCPYKIWLTCTKACWVGITSLAGNYQTNRLTSILNNNISSSTVVEYLTPNMATSSQDIGIITYRATTTQISATSSVIDSQFYSPFILFGFIFIVALMALIVVYMFLTTKKKYKV